MKRQSSYKANDFEVPHLDMISEMEGDEDGMTSSKMTSRTGHASVHQSNGFSIFVSDKGYKVSLGMKESASIRKPMNSYLESSIFI